MSMRIINYSQFELSGTGDAAGRCTKFRKAPGGRKPRKLSLEPLEDRTLLSITGALPLTTQFIPGDCGPLALVSSQVNTGAESSRAGSVSFRGNQPAVTHGSITFVKLSAKSSVFGQTETITATVTTVSPSGPTPTGTVQVSIDGSSFGSPLALSGGTASTSTSTLAAGVHTIGVAYSGDANFLASSGSKLATVLRASTSTTIVSSSNPAMIGQTVTFTANVSDVAPGPGLPTGSVSFVHGNTTLATVPLSGNTASFTPASLSPGIFSLTASYNGDANFSPSTAAKLIQTVNKDNSSTMLASSVNPSAFGQTVTFSATVSASDPSLAITPTGKVRFIDGATTLASVALSSAHASFSTSALTAGNHTITVVYTGDNNFNTSTSAPLRQTVNGPGASTTTTIASSANPSVFGQSVTLTATITGNNGTPIGTVQFAIDGSNFGGAITLAGGLATVSTDSLSVGTHSISAVYSGGSGFSPSMGSLSGGQTVSQANTTTTITADSNPSVFGQTVTFTAEVSVMNPGSTVAGIPTGTVTFFDGSTEIGSGNLSTSAGVTTATFATPGLSVGTHTITAKYAGDTNFNNSSDLSTQLVNPADTATTVTSGVNPSALGQSVTFTATVSAAAPGSGTPTGTVDFIIDGSDASGPVTLSGGSASFSTASLRAGVHTIAASYSGDANFNSGSASLPGGQTVAGGSSTTTSLVSLANPSVFGQGVSFTATVSASNPNAGTPTGTVQFVVDGSNFGDPVPLTAGLATSLTFTTFTVGTHEVDAMYSGDATFSPSAGSTMQTVNQDDSISRVNLSAKPAAFGETETITATILPASPGSGTPTGMVQVSIDGGNFGPLLTLSEGTASISTSTLAVGTHTIGLAYSGDTNFLASTGTGLLTVVRATTSTTLASSLNPSVVGQMETITATVNVVAPGVGSPTGTVTFTEGSLTLATVPLSGNSASFSTSSLSVGNHVIAAVYSGDTNFADSTSTKFVQTVTNANSSTALISSLNPAVEGQTVRFTATVTAMGPGPGTPTGVVNFFDGTTKLATLNLSAGSVVFSTSGLVADTHTMTAVYLGDANFNVSTSNVVLQTIRPSPLSSSPAITAHDAGPVVPSSLDTERLVDACMVLFGQSMPMRPYIGAAQIDLTPPQFRGGLGHGSESIVKAPNANDRYAVASGSVRSERDLLFQEPSDHEVQSVWVPTLRQK
jgi:hypothetical protein